jgi:excisionase family DNA binding protein
MNLLTTIQVAAMLGVTDRRVRQLITEGKIKARQFGGVYLIEPSAIKNLKVQGYPGRPRKEAA